MTPSTPVDFFQTHAALVPEIAPKYARRLRPHAYEGEDVMQEGLLALWRLALKPRHHLRPLSRPYVATVIARALSRLKRYPIFQPLGEV